MKKSKYVVYWLLTGCFLIFVMVLVGGITRLTHSGLSISDYKLIHGTIPPMNEQEWQEAFELNHIVKKVSRFCILLTFIKSVYIISSASSSII